MWMLRFQLVSRVHRELGREWWANIPSKQLTTCVFLVARHRPSFPLEDDAFCSDRRMEINPYLHQEKLHLTPDCPSDSKLLKVAILGTPNSGKSVLTNCLAGNNICATSSKPDTTRRLTYAVSVHGDAQMIYADTPGVASPEHKKKVKGDDFMFADAELALKQSQLICVLVDASNPFCISGLHMRILHLLYRYQAIPSVLVLNKIDAVKTKDQLLEITYRLCNGIVDAQPIPRTLSKILREHEEAKANAAGNGDNESEFLDKDLDSIPIIQGSFRPASRHSQQQKTKQSAFLGGNFAFDSKVKCNDATVDVDTLAKIVKIPSAQLLNSQLQRCFKNTIGWPYFDAVFMTSALLGTGTEPLKEYLLDNACAGQWKYHSSVLTDQTPEELVLNIVRGKLLDFLKQEIPYNLELRTVVWEINEHEVLCIRLDVLCPNSRTVKLLIGPKGETIQQISYAANQELRNVFKRDVYLKLGAIITPKPKIDK